MVLEKAQKWFEKKTGVPPLDKLSDFLELVKSLEAIPAKKLEQIKEILTLATELQQATGSEGLKLAVELVRLVAEVPEERVKQVSQLVQRAEKLVKSLPPETIGLLKEGASALKEG